MPKCMPLTPLGSCVCMFNSLHAAKVFMLLTFFKINSFKRSFRNSIGMSNGLDPDQDRHVVGPDLGPNCLQRLSLISRQQKLPLSKKE